MRECTAFLFNNGLLRIAGSCVIRIKSFQPSRDPIPPETGLGQRAGRFPVCAFGYRHVGRKLLGRFERAAQIVPRCKRSSVCSTIPIGDAALHFWSESSA